MIQEIYGKTITKLFTWAARMGRKVKGTGGGGSGQHQQVGRKGRMLREGLRLGLVWGGG
jgi:hypothetical protein